MPKERLDVLLVKKGLFSSREKAKAEIMMGNIFVGNNKEDKPGAMFDDNIDIRVKETSNPYVSRGGLKLEKALKVFNIDLHDKIAMDIGASTGGFTDCMLKNQVKKVFAVDVGYGQLAWELRNNPKVVCMERTNIRNVTFDQIGELLDFATIDVAFISLKKVIPVVKSFLKDKGEMVCLIKPQFEAGRDKVGKHGVVRDSKVHFEVISDIAIFCIQSGFYIKGIDYSPIKGPEGNIEYLIYISKEINKQDNGVILDNIRNIVDQSHK